MRLAPPVKNRLNAAGEHSEPEDESNSPQSLEFQIQLEAEPRLWNRSPTGTPAPSADFKWT